MTTVTVSPRFQVVIPQVIRNALGIRPGQRIQALQYENRIELIPLRPMHKARGMLKGIETEVKRDRDPHERETPAITPQQSSYVPKTDMGRKLLELRNEAIRDGMKLLTASQINEEVARRRGRSA